jgi:hypothetical protein
MRQPIFSLLLDRREAVRSLGGALGVPSLPGFRAEAKKNKRHLR